MWAPVLSVLETVPEEICLNSSSPLLSSEEESSISDFAKSLYIGFLKEAHVSLQRV